MAKLSRRTTASFCGALLSASTAVLVACGSPNGGGAGGTMAGAPGQDAGRAAGGRCEVAITGDLTARFTAPNGMSAVGTDYWSTEQEMRETLTTFVREEQVPQVAIAATVDARMKEDPRIRLLFLNCSSDRFSVTLVPSASSRSEHVPFAPRQYAITKGLAGDRTLSPGAFVALAAVGSTPFVTVEPGVLTIEKFDTSAIAGSFSFVAADASPASMPRRISVTGRFQFICRTSAMCGG